MCHAVWSAVSGAADEQTIVWRVQARVVYMYRYRSSHLAATSAVRAEACETHTGNKQAEQSIAVLELHREDDAYASKCNVS